MAPRVASLLGWLLFAATGHAATLCVNPGGTGGCFASVQAAVDAAASGDTIAVAAGTYAEHVLIEGKRLDVVGDDPTTTLIDGSGTGRPMTVRGPGTRLTLTRLGIRNAGPGFTLIPNVAVSNSKVTISECRLTGSNSAGLADQEDNSVHLHRARLTVIETTIEGNASVGVFLFGQSSITLIRSTISGNGDSGITVTGKGSRVRVEDSTISGNATLGDGGGIYVIASTVRLVRSTVVSNTAQGLGGGIFADTGARVRSEATILANNLHMGATPNECALGPASTRPAGRFVSRGFNVIENGCPSVGATDLDVTGQDPLLGPLQNNGGPTFTHAPMAGSPALGIVTRTRTCEEPDQRGVVRAVPCDSGSYEAP